MSKANRQIAAQDYENPKEFSQRWRRAEAFTLTILDDLTVISCSPQSADVLPFEVTPGKPLQLKDRETRNRLTRAMARLARSESGGSFFIPMDESERNSSIYIVVSRKNVRDASAETRPHYLLTLCNLTESINVSAEALEEGLDLTPMEARLCIALLNEQSLQNFAEAHDLTIATARWHWSNVRQKLNVRTQLALVRMLMRLAGP